MQKGRLRRPFCYSTYLKPVTYDLNFLPAFIQGRGFYCVPASLVAVEEVSLPLLTPFPSSIHLERISL